MSELEPPTPAAPLPETLITYPLGDLTSTSTVLATTSAGDATVVIVDRTPFHPVDHRWPDQGPDRGTIAVSGTAFPVIDCVLAAAADSDPSTIFLGADIPVRKGEDGWVFLVGHVVAGAPGLVPGDQVTLAVDDEHRRALSAGHTVCHVASAALNEMMAPRWRKEVPLDSLGRPNFDSASLSTSLHHRYGSVDVYRLGKSLRKKGFSSDGLADELGQIERRLNERLAESVALSGRIGWEIAGPALTDRRIWSCPVSTGTMTEPCGGTHLVGLSELAAITVTLELNADESELTMTATAVMA